MIDLVVEALTLNLQYIQAASMYSQLVFLPPRAEAATAAASRRVTSLEQLSVAEFSGG